MKIWITHWDSSYSVYMFRTEMTGYDIKRAHYENIVKTTFHTVRNTRQQNNPVENDYLWLVRDAFPNLSKFPRIILSIPATSATIGKEKSQVAQCLVKNTFIVNRPGSFCNVISLSLHKTQITDLRTNSQDLSPTSFF